MRKFVNLLNEIGMLSKTPRSGFAFLGTGSQSVAEHSYRTAIIALVLAELVNQPIDKYKLLLLCLFHDLPEARTGDLNYVNKRYGKVDLSKALEDIEKSSPLGAQIVEHIHEHEKNECLEAKLAHEADKLELLLCLKQELDTGNPRASEWFDKAARLLHTETGKKLAAEIRNTPFDEWWLEDEKKLIK